MLSERSDAADRLLLSACLKMLYDSSATFYKARNNWNHMHTSMSPDLIFRQHGLSVLFFFFSAFDCQLSDVGEFWKWSHFATKIPHSLEQLWLKGVKVTTTLWWSVEKRMKGPNMLRKPQSWLSGLIVILFSLFCSCMMSALTGDAFRFFTVCHFLQGFIYRFLCA